MNKANSLEEDVRHGTKEQPITVMQFEAGKGTIYPEGFFVERHWHRGIEMLKVLEGSYTVEVNLENVVIQKGDFCIINSEELHQIRGNEPISRHEIIIFQPEILTFSYTDEFQELLVEPLVSMHNSFATVIRPVAEGYEKMEAIYNEIVETVLAGGKGWYYDAKLGLLAMVRQFERYGLLLSAKNIQGTMEKEKIDRYKRMISYIEENYMKKITLGELAEAAQCNPQYLCHFFKEIAGVPPVQYLIGYRIEKAKEALEHSTKTVLEISFDCGFENVSYFIRQFKKAVGMTPREYRKNDCRF